MLVITRNGEQHCWEARDDGLFDNYAYLVRQRNASPCGV